MDAVRDEVPKFGEDSQMSFLDVHAFAVRDIEPILQSVADQLGREQFLAAIERAAHEQGLALGREAAAEAPSNDLAGYVARIKAPSRFARHVLTIEIVEDTPEAVELKVTECLWASVYRALGAADLGAALICGQDQGHCQGFNPRIRMVRTKTLMQGDAYCNHRFVWTDPPPAR
ncbi:MAG: L-2-amino-thiazoline-4-carboxylic acid hydrolase [Chloroflexi bacterium]|nr:L-2-amino-thiazoline-4-carboxylic acid hydrolase [Chloroflexota bacterium]